MLFGFERASCIRLGCKLSSSPIPGNLNVVHFLAFGSPNFDLLVHGKSIKSIYSAQPHLVYEGESKKSHSYYLKCLYTNIEQLYLQLHWTKNYNFYKLQRGCQQA